MRGDEEFFSLESGSGRETTGTFVGPYDHGRPVGTSYLRYSSKSALE